MQSWQKLVQPQARGTRKGEAEQIEQKTVELYIEMWGIEGKYGKLREIERN